jgi:hypothetical protein
MTTARPIRLVCTARCGYRCSDMLGGCSLGQSRSAAPHRMSWLVVILR